jgi:hypothetical protein
MFDANFGESINDRCVAEALSVRDMLSPAPARPSPRRGWEIRPALTRLDHFMQDITAMIRRSRFAPMKEANPVR